tara:strand:- start:1179 stop:2432 length:1254 start_codon:yes stop_codon:yes gene_type:complete
MSDGYGTPIRLHFDAGILGDLFGGDPFPPMELQALSIALSVERKVGGMPLPLMGGKRLGIDLNMVNSTIVIEGIFTDDDVNRRNTAATGATAQIDFAVNHADLNSVGNFTQVADTKFIELCEGSDSKVTIRDKGLDKDLRIFFSKSNDAAKFTSTGTTNVGNFSAQDFATIFVHSTNGITPAEMAASLATALGPSFLNSTITTAISTSEFVPAAGSSKITLSQSTTGKMTGTGSVSFTTNRPFAPYHLPFTGGSSASTSKPKSAGDKVQDLYGILHNTDRGTAALIIAGIAGAAAFALTGGAALAAGAVAGGGVVSSLDGLFSGDYPIGLQIPYNSMITAEDGRKYDVRNFLVPTGLFRSTNEKISEGNTKSANVDFSTSDEMTGIQGTIQKFDVGYNAGEQHYTYQMVFAPIDMII